MVRQLSVGVGAEAKSVIDYRELASPVDICNLQHPSREDPVHWPPQYAVS
jgi:hypothetical protein